MVEKKIKGRKRHIVTDTQGHLLHVNVHAANIHDTVSGCNVFKNAIEKYPTVQGVDVDAGYRKTFENFGTNVLNKIVNISTRISDSFIVIPKRWAVERTFSWFNGSRRLAKDFEICLSSAENWIIISHMRLLLRRLVRS